MDIVLTLPQREREIVLSGLTYWKLFQSGLKKKQSKKTSTMFFGFQSFVYLKASVQGKKNPNPVQLMSNRGLFSNKLLPLKWSNVSSDTENLEG